MLRSAAHSLLATPSSERSLAVLAPAVALWICPLIYRLLYHEPGELNSELVLELAMVAMFGLVVLVWTTLHFCTFVGGGSSAGFGLAALGLAARVHVSSLVALCGGERDGSVYEALPDAAWLIGCVRNGSLFAFGWGLGLVAWASIADIARGRLVASL